MNEIEPLYVQYLDTEPIQVDQLDAKRDCTQLAYFNTKMFSMIQEIKTNATIAVNSNVDCNLL